MPAAATAAALDGPALGVSGRSSVTLFYVLAFFSGLAALVYEVAWAQMLALTFGSTTLSAAAVVAGFMGGMGIGAWLYHFVGRRVRRPIVVYAVLEIAIALAAAALSATFYALPEAFAGLSRTLTPGILYDGVRFASVFALLLVPAVLMGATFPALCTVIIRSAPGVDRHLGAIYGVNTVGAAIGVLVAGLVLIERIGLTGSVRVANAINIAVGLGALLLLRSPLGRAPTGVVSPTAAAIPTDLPRVVTGIVLFGSGLCTLAYEILWFRALRYLTGTSTYAFTIVLFTFLMGLGLGALLLRRVARRSSPEGDLAVCQCIIAVLALAAMAMQLLLLEIPALHDRVSIFSNAVRFSPWWQRLTVDVIVASITMLPGTIFMGLSFPLATRLFLGDVRRVDARVGTAYLLSNVGAILGAVGAAVFLLPVFGTLGGTKVCAVINVLLAGIVLVALGGRRRRAQMIVAQITVAIVVVGMIALPGTVGFYAEDLESDVAGTVIFTEEGDLATVQVLQHPDVPDRRAMTIDGYKIGWGRGFRGTVFYRKQLLLAHLPMALDTRIRRTLNVGLGSSATLEALGTYRDIERLECVEINGAVVRGSSHFDESRVLDDPRTRLVVDDAVHHLLRSTERFDLIVSDGKQDPFYSGNAVLLCREFYEFARERLTEHGIFAQWIPLGTLPADFEIIVRTFTEAFPHADAYFFPPESVLLVGATAPLNGRPRLAADDAWATTTGLGAYFIPSPDVLVAHRVAGREQLRRVVGEGPVSHWDHLVLDFSPFTASVEEWANAQPRNLALLIEAEMVDDGSLYLPSTDAEETYRLSAALLRRALLARLQGNREAAVEFARRALAANPEDGSVRFFLRSVGAD